MNGSLSSFSTGKNGSRGIVFCHMVHVAKLLKNRRRTAAVRLAGGAAKSRTWAAIVDVKEIGALGCAMAAEVASGVNTDLKDAATHMVTIKHRVEPDAGNAAIYARKYQRYRTVSDALDRLWRDFS